MKVLLWVDMVVLIAIGLLLLINHPGFAIRISNYLFYLLVVESAWLFLKSNKK